MFVWLVPLRLWGPSDRSFGTVAPPHSCSKGRWFLSFDNFYRLVAFHVKLLDPKVRELTIFALN